MIGLDNLDRDQVVKLKIAIGIAIVYYLYGKRRVVSKKPLD